MMKRLMTLGVVAAGAVVISACNGGTLDALGGGTSNGGMSAEQTAALESLSGHFCQVCESPADGPTSVLEVGIHPATYTGGPLELVVQFVDPNGVVDANGAIRIDATLTINDLDMLANLPAEAWRVSADGKRARLYFEAVDGLPAGIYHVRASITDPDLGTADNTAVYEVAEHHEPTPTPTSTDHTEPTPTPTPDHTPEPTHTPVI